MSKTCQMRDNSTSFQIYFDFVKSKLVFVLLHKKQNFFKNSPCILHDLSLTFISTGFEYKKDTRVRSGLLFDEYQTRDSFTRPKKSEKTLDKYSNVINVAEILIFLEKKK